MDTDKLADQIATFIDEHRARCLWSIRKDFYPENGEAVGRILDHVVSAGNLDDYKRAGKLKACMTTVSSEKLAASLRKAASKAGKAI